MFSNFPFKFTVSDVPSRCSLEKALRSFRLYWTWPTYSFRLFLSPDWAPGTAPPVRCWGLTTPSSCRPRCRWQSVSHQSWRPHHSPGQHRGIHTENECQSWFTVSMLAAQSFLRSHIRSFSYILSGLFLCGCYTPLLHSQLFYFFCKALPLVPSSNQCYLN